MNLWDALRNSGKVIKEGLITPNKFNKPAADRFKGSALPMLGIPGAVAETADELYKGNPGMAALAATGAIPGIGVAGTMISKTGKLFDKKAAEEAVDMLRKGRDPHRTTGIYQGPDKQLYQEITDMNVKMDQNAYDALREGRVVPYGKILPHDEMFANYPDMAKLRTKMIPGNRSYYDHNNGTIALGKDSPDPRGTLLHEGTHGIQFRTPGAALGGSPSEFSIKYPSLDEVDWTNISPMMKKYDIPGDEGYDPYMTLDRIYRDAQQAGATEAELAPLRGNMAWMRSAQETPEEQYMNMAGEVQARLVAESSRMNPVQQRMNSPANRMFEMGYPIHGQTVKPNTGDTNGIIQGLRSKNTGPAMAIEKLFHGGSYVPGQPIERKLYAAKDKQMADTFVEMANDRFGDFNSTKEFTADLLKQAPEQEVMDIAKQLGIDNSYYTPAAIFDDNLHSPDSVDSLIDALRAKGYDHTVLPDIPYGYGHSGANGEPIEEMAHILFPNAKVIK